MNVKFALQKLEYDDLRTNFQLIQEVLRTQKLLQTWEFFDVSVDAATTAKKIRHGLGVVPKDIITTRLTGVLTFDYDLFDKQFIYLTTTGPARARFFVGTYKEE